MNPSAETGNVTMQPNPSAASKIAVMPPMVRNERMTTVDPVQAERIMRRELNRQFSRRSARRSRFFRQAECAECAECAEVHARLQALRLENQLLRESLQKLYEEWDKIAYANILMKGELNKIGGQEKLPELDVFLRSRFSEG